MIAGCTGPPLLVYNCMALYLFAFNFAYRTGEPHIQFSRLNHHNHRLAHRRGTIACPQHGGHQGPLHVQLYLRIGADIFQTGRNRLSFISLLLPLTTHLYYFLFLIPSFSHSFSFIYLLSLISTLARAPSIITAKQSCRTLC